MMHTGQKNTGVRVYLSMRYYSALYGISASTIPVSGEVDHLGGAGTCRLSITCPMVPGEHVEIGNRCNEQIILEDLILGKQICSNFYRFSENSAS